VACACQGSHLQLIKVYCVSSRTCTRTRVRSEEHEERSSGYSTNYRMARERENVSTGKIRVDNLKLIYWRARSIWHLDEHTQHKVYTTVKESWSYRAVLLCIYVTRPRAIVLPSAGISHLNTF
jgi:hypothetical protein